MKPANALLSSYGTTVFEVMSRLAIEHQAICQGAYFLFVDASPFLKPGEDDEVFCRRLVLSRGWKPI